MSIKKTDFKPKQESNQNDYEDVNNLTNDNVKALVSVGSTKISVADIACTYDGVTKNENVLNEIIKAHNEVLTHGLSKGTEMVIAIDLDTGATVAKGYGTETATKFSYIDKNYRGKAVTIHNHTSSGSFTPTDLVTFSRDKNSHMSVIQAHNGKIYSLQKTKIGNVVLEETLNSELLEIALKHNYEVNKDMKTLLAIYNEFACKVAIKNDWIYKGGKNNG